MAASGRVYIGERTALGLRVLVDDGKVQVPLEHYVRHSPTGFECGYGGSGPADLARCILIDHFDLHHEVRAGRELLPVDYQAFKFEVIAGLPNDAAWNLSSEEVQAWVELFGGDDGDH